MTSEPRFVTDFGGILDQLRRAGFTMSALERETGIPRPSLVGYLIGGTTPLHPQGEKLIEFWCRAMDTPRERVPQRRWYPSVAESLR